MPSNTQRKLPYLLHFLHPLPYTCPTHTKPLPFELSKLKIHQQTKSLQYPHKISSTLPLKSFSIRLGCSRWSSWEIELGMLPCNWLAERCREVKNHKPKWYMTNQLIHLSSLTDRMCMFSSWKSLVGHVCVLIFPASESCFHWV